MPTNLSIESPDFDKIRKESGLATEDSIRLLWFVLNDEIRSRRVGIRQAKEYREGKVLTLSPSAQQDDLDSRGAFVLEFAGSTAVTLTGIRNPVPGRTLILHVTGSGTITVADQHTDSDAANRIVTNSGSDVAVTTNASMILYYLNGRWREFSAA